MPKRVLHFFPHKLRERHGGPYSVLFHLKQGLQSYQHNVFFLEDLISFKETVLPGKKKSSLKQVAKLFVPKTYLSNRLVKNWLKEVAVLDEEILHTVDIHKWDILHFHETIDLWRYQDFLKGFKGKLVLTSHSPKPYHLELLEDVMQLTKNNISPAPFKTIEDIDIYAFTKADHLIFPCAQATESFKTLWPYFTNSFKKKKVSFISTGVKSHSNGEKINTVRSDYGIPPGAFVVTFIGRKNAVKGYDLLVEAAKKLLQANAHIYFIVVGKKENGVSLHHSHWIEVGWSEDPLHFVEAADLHIVPNRYTNFDLNVLEALPLNIPLLLSNSGGNKYFKQFKAEGIIYHEPNINDLAEKLEYAYHNRKKLKEAAIANINIYKENFTAYHFAKQTLEFYESL